MDKLNEYLQALLSTCSEELHLEPDSKPYLVSGNSMRSIANVPILGTQISMMVFPLIPPEAKAALPHNPEVEFVYEHTIGKFNFVVQKSPAGFNVTVRPMMSEVTATSGYRPLPAEAPVNGSGSDVPYLTADPEPEPQPAAKQEFVFESSSAGMEYNAELPAVSSFTPDLVSEMPLTEHTSVETSDRIEIVAVNDPEFTTVFSPAAEDEPPSRLDRYESGEYVPQQGSAAVPIFESPIEAVPPPMPFEPPAPVLPPPVDPPAPEPQTADFEPAAVDGPMRERMDSLFRQMAEIGASDLHMSVSVPPMIRKDGRMASLGSSEPTLTPESIRELLTSIMPPANQQQFAEKRDTDFAYEIAGLARFRCNIFMDRKGMGAVFRIIPSKILTAEQLNLSKAIMDLCTLSKGLVVVTGPTGSGKSTTLCAMVDSINKEREEHIITIEDPIEFVHENQKCLVNQREVHNHTDGFKQALRAALREDPDIVLVGEMRDLETISIAIETAETGHLVFGTLHTTTAASTVDRIIDQFPADRQQQIRVMLSESLKGVIAQTLLPKKGGGRVAALEVLIVTPAVSNLIREGKTFQIPSAMQTGKNHGMVMLNDALFEHVQNGTVEARDAHQKAVDKGSFETMLTRAGITL
ncbi:MAG: PilT/PilU family type 4a pilus ATPase [Acidobacteriota bacterium]